MWGRLATKLVIRLLKNARLSNQDKQLLTASLLTQLGALPLHDRVVVDDLNRIFIDGKPLTLEAARTLHESSKILLNNFARKVVREQVTFMAIHKGIHENVSPEQGLFAKAALWFLQEEDKLYRKFAMTEADNS